MGSFWESIKYKYKTGDAIRRLIMINLGVFVALGILSLFATLFSSSELVVKHSMLSLPSSYDQLFRQPWSIITYMFLHSGIFHLLANVISLYWFGKVLTSQIKDKAVYTIYFFGGILGGVLFLLANNYLPYFIDQGTASLVGASAGVMAVVVSAGMLGRNLRIPIPFIGNIKLITIVYIYIAIDVIQITGPNGGGSIAHLGGALAGYLWYQLRERAAGAQFNWAKNAKTPKSTRTKKGKMTFRYQRPVSDYEYNKQKAEKNERVDEILDKIKKYGYDSLTKAEKKDLFDSGK